MSTPAGVTWRSGSMATAPPSGGVTRNKYPFQEGSFFGNIYASPPQAYYCEGKDFDNGQVRGRIGADVSGAPYVNKFGNGAACADYCTAADAPYSGDGFKACGGFNHVITVWRDFAPDMWYKICNRKSGTCMSVDNNSSSLGHPHGGRILEEPLLPELRVHQRGRQLQHPSAKQQALARRARQHHGVGRDHPAIQLDAAAQTSAGSSSRWAADGTTSSAATPPTPRRPCA